MTSLLLFPVSAHSQSCPSILASTEAGLKDLLEILPRRSEIREMKAPEEIEALLWQANRWRKNQSRGGKKKYCCIKPFSKGKNCSGCPYPQLYKKDAVGHRVAKRVRALQKRLEKLKKSD